MHERSDSLFRGQGAFPSADAPPYPEPVHRRMNALLLLDDGWATERIAEVLFIDAETGREHRRLYQTGGVSGVERLGVELDARL
jgi:hypothetical protein